MNAIQTAGLTKRYGNKNVVEGLDLHVPEGAIYGFIGRNGAGKSTTQKLICGLTPITSGSIELYGADHDDPKIRSQVGMLIENAGVYASLTARENMRLYGLAIGMDHMDEEIDKTLKLMGIADTGKKTVKQFSLGMKQRLGIAIALLGDPKLLILDEPINGLDPQGIIEFREVMLKLNREKGMTILISSHILGELAKIATHYGIINEGAMVKEMSAAELETICQNYLLLKVDRARSAGDLLMQAFHGERCEVLSDGEVHLFGVSDTRAVNTLLYQKGYEVEEIYMHQQDLEEYFMKLMGGEKNA